MNNLGILPLAAQFVISVGSWMLKRDVSARIATQYAMAEFDYLKRVSDAELTAIAFDMAGRFPQYRTWQWFRILQDVRTYGGSIRLPEDPALPPGTKDPGEKDKEKTSSTWIWAALGVLVFWMLTER